MGKGCLGCAHTSSCHRCDGAECVRESESMLWDRVTCQVCMFALFKTGAEQSKTKHFFEKHYVEQKSYDRELYGVRDCNDAPENMRKCLKGGLAKEINCTYIGK